MVSIKFISSASQQENNKIVEKELFGVHQTKCIYVREAGVNRKLLSADFNGRFSIGDYQSDYKLDISDEQGECLKLWNDKTVRPEGKHATFKVTADGYLDLNTSGNQILSNSLIKLSQPLESISGGTGFNTFTKGDMVVGDTAGSLSKLSVTGGGNKYFLLKNKNSSLGVEYGLDIFEDYCYMSPPSYISSLNYYIDKIKMRDYQNRDTIIMSNTGLDILSSIVEESDTGELEYPASTMPLVNTSKFQYGDIINIKDSRLTTSNGVQTFVEYRKITAVQSGVSISVDTPFTLLSSWSIGGTASTVTTQARFGTRSLACTATTTFARINTNSSLNIGSTWTVEMFVRLNAITAAQSVIIANTANTFRINFNNLTPRFRISLGQGTTYDIANNLSGATAIAANTWYHVAVVKSTTNYLFFVNGVLQNTIASTLVVPTASFTNLKLGGDATLLNGFIDEFRLSSINRYTAAFTPTATAFSVDNRTISLNHFELVDVNQSDDLVNSSISSNTFTVFRDGYLYRNSVFYSYVYRKNINGVDSDSITLSTRNSEENIDLINDPTVTAIKRVPFYVTTTSTNAIPYSTLLCGGYFDIHPNISLVSASSNTTELITSLVNFLPIYANRIRIMIVHTHVGAIECGISIGTRSELKNTYLTTNVASITSLTVDIPIINLQLISNLSILAGTTSYSISMLGYHC